LSRGREERRKRNGFPRVLAVAGGGLQGLEITYLARKAGFETLLLDRREDPPARGLCNGFIRLDLTQPGPVLDALKAVDLVLPATENPAALRSLERCCAEAGVLLAFDSDAFALTSSKTRSGALFRELAIRTPPPWPGCGFPVLAKPDRGSGSKGVEVFVGPRELEARFGPTFPPEYVLQGFLPGPSSSVEVMGDRGSYMPIQVTGLEMAPDFDCKRVLAPAALDRRLERELGEIAVKVATALNLTGIMDVEAIAQDGALVVLEIDARFPSQTPIAVYHSTGFNMVEGLVSTFLGREPKGLRALLSPRARGVILEHIHLHGAQLSVRGEGILAGAGPLHLENRFFGADEALTNYAPGQEEWVATLMVTGSDLLEARRRREAVIRGIRERFGVAVYSDEGPSEPAGGGP
jgi:pyrrolysine biosynthesis protein PylC